MTTPPTPSPPAARSVRTAAFVAVIVAVAVIIRMGGGSPAPSTAHAVASPIASPISASPAAASPVANPIAALVEIRNDDYDPGGVRITVGETIRWVNRDGVTHTVTDDDGVFTSGAMHRGEGFRHTFTEPGTYAYGCDLHLEMSGAVVVSRR